MFDLRRWMCILLAGVISAGVIYLHSQFPRATITLEPGPAKEFMFASPRDLHFLPGSRRLITKDWYQQIGDGGDPPHFRLRLWDARNGRFLASILEGPDHEGLTFAPDGTQFIVHHQGLTIWDAERGKPARKLHLADEFAQCVYVRDKACFMNLKSELRDLESGEIVPAPDAKTMCDLHDRLRQVSNSGLLLLHTPICVVDPSAGKVLLKLPPEQSDMWRKWAFTDDGRFLVARRGRSQVGFWNLADLSHMKYDLAFRPSHESFAPDGETIATAYGIEERGTIRSWLLWCKMPVKDSDFWMKVYHMPTGRVVFERYGAILGVFAPDGKTLAVLRDDNVVELWDWPIRVPWPTIAVTATVTMALIFVYTRRAKQRK
jgi:WD40 repeat protein